VGSRGGGDLAARWGLRGPLVEARSGDDPARRDDVAGAADRTHLDHFIARLGTEPIHERPVHRLSLRQVFAMDDEDVGASDEVGTALGETQPRGSVEVEAGQECLEERGQPIAQVASWRQQVKDGHGAVSREGYLL
jgi:hypothetical protein